MATEILEKEEKTEDIKTDNFETNDEGELIVYPEGETTDPDADSEKEQSEEGKLDDTKKDDDSTDEFDTKYPNLKGKTREEIAEMNVEGQRKITEATTARADAEKLLKDKNLTFEEKLELLSPEQIKQMIAEERDTIAEFDEDEDSKKIADSKRIIGILETQFSVVYATRKADEKINDRLNNEFIPRMKENWKKDGFGLNDDEFSDLTELARKYREDGQLTVRSYDKAMLDKYGPERFSKFHEIKGGEQSRKDMAETKEKETHTSGTGGGRTGGIPFEQLKGKQRQEFLSTLSPEALRRLKERLPKTF